MMRRILLGAACMAVMVTAKAQEYAVSKIPKELKEDALAVIRKQDVTYELISEKKAIYREHTVVTIFKDDADVLANVDVIYDKLSRVVEMKAIVYDRFGNQIDKLKKSDISDESLISGFSLYEDDRMKSADMSQNAYPYTVESFVEKEYNYVYTIPHFYPQKYSPVAVETASYKLTAPSDIFPRYKEVNFNGTKEESNDSNTKTMVWNISNLETVDLESFGLVISDKVPHVLLGATKFEYDGYTGDMSTWDGYMIWMRKLQTDRNTLSDETVSILLDKTKGMTDYEKARVIYQYMQGRTRYVSIQDGIGGVQPFESGLVDEVGYGDCKALSFYTKSMLEAVGIDSYYALIYAGERPRKFHSDFPHHFGNHAILMVPLESDTVWLECTSQVKPFGYMGSFTDDRDVVIITEEGADIVKTPRYDHKVNTQFRTINVHVKEGGEADIDAVTTYRGLQYENGNLDSYVHLGRDKQEKWVYNNTDIPSYELVDFSIENRPDIIPEAEVSLELHVKKLTSISGKRVFFTPNLMNKVENFLPNMEERNDPVFIRTGSYDIDTVIYEFPSNLRAEYVPEASEIKSKYGYYHTSYEFIQGKLVYVRTFKFYEGTYSHEEYEDLFQFLRAVEREDKKKVVLLKGT